MAEEKLIPCSSDGKRYATNICQHMQGYLQFNSTKKSKGFFSGNAVMISSGESLGKKITYQDGKIRQYYLIFARFVVVNYTV